MATEPVTQLQAKGCQGLPATLLELGERHGKGSEASLPIA